MRFLYYFGIILFFSLFYGIYAQAFQDMGAPVTSINESNVAQEYAGTEYNGTIDTTSFLGGIGKAVGILKMMFVAMLLPSHIIAELGVPGSDVIGMILNVLFWVVEGGALIEVFSKVRGV
jgi:hypothetical protein